MSKIKILIVDDHELIRSGIASQLQSVKDIEIVPEQGSDGAEAIALAKKYKPEIVLMDLKMPNMDGFEATRKLLQLIPDIKILILTVCDNKIFPLKLLEANAAGYITKDCKPKDLIDAIKKVHAGQRYVSPEIAQKLALNNNSSPLDKLSDREFQVMNMIIKGQKAPQIAATLHLSAKTVNTYRYRIFEKLEVSSDVELTRLALQYGIITSNNIESQ
ncbi:MAG: response regulator [Gammaproteobacteria bacterium]|jgi:two-component system invasion response regulator UvrY